MRAAAAAAAAAAAQEAEALERWRAACSAQGRRAVEAVYGGGGGALLPALLSRLLALTPEELSRWDDDAEGLLALPMTPDYQDRTWVSREEFRRRQGLAGMTEEEIDRS